MKALTTILLILISLAVFAQCDNRYIDEIFDSVEVSTIQYSSVYNLDVDIYQPVGDTLAERPLIILAHGGAFYTGTKESGTMVDLCTDFAKRGYVTASIQYRLASSILDLLDSLTALDIVIKAMSDGKSAVRFFREGYANGNPYRIDQSQIYGGGNSAGGVLFSHIAILDQNEVPSYIDTVLQNNGGFEGNSGNPGFSSTIKAVISLAGAVNKKSWIDANDPPIVSCHGTKDNTVPYYCDDPLKSVHMGYVDVIDLCGGGKMQERIDEVGGVGALRTFWDQDHVPWAGDSADYALMFEFVRDFLYQSLDCSGGIISLRSDTVNMPEDSSVTFISETPAATFHIYPNPVKEELFIEAEPGSLTPYSVRILNLNGQELVSEESISGNTLLDVSHLPAGFYFVDMASEGMHSVQSFEIIR